MNKVCLCAGLLQDYWMDFSKAWWEDGERAKKKMISVQILIKGLWVPILPHEEIQTCRGWVSVSVASFSVIWQSYMFYRVLFWCSYGEFYACKCFQSCCLPQITPWGWTASGMRPEMNLRPLFWNALMTFGILANRAAMVRDDADS